MFKELKIYNEKSSMNTFKRSLVARQIDDLFKVCTSVDELVMKCALIGVNLPSNKVDLVNWAAIWLHKNASLRYCKDVGQKTSVGAKWVEIIVKYINDVAWRDMKKEHVEKLLESIVFNTNRLSKVKLDFVKAWLKNTNSRIKTAGRTCEKWKRRHEKELH